MQAGSTTSFLMGQTASYPSSPLHLWYPTSAFGLVATFSTSSLRLLPPSRNPNTKSMVREPHPQYTNPSTRTHVSCIIYLASTFTTRALYQHLIIPLFLSLLTTLQARDRVDHELLRVHFHTTRPPRRAALHEIYHEISTESPTDHVLLHPPIKGRGTQSPTSFTQSHNYSTNNRGKRWVTLV